MLVPVLVVLVLVVLDRRAKVGRPGSGQTKSGKPRPGTGGYGKRALEGKGPTPPAVMRPGHPAQRRAAAAASGGARGRRQDDGPPRAVPVAGVG